MSTFSESYHHGSLREALIEAGINVLEGPDGKEISLRELARQVGVSATAVYRHFPDKRALHEAIARKGLERLAAQQKQAAERAGGGPRGFAETGRAYVRFALAHPVLFRQMFNRGRPEPDKSTPDTAAQLLSANALALSSTPEQAERLALQAWSIAHGVAMLMLDGRIPADDALIDSLLDTDSLFPVQGKSNEESP